MSFWLGALLEIGLDLKLYVSCIWNRLLLLEENSLKQLQKHFKVTETEEGMFVFILSDVDCGLTTGVEL